jgi:hypothetical protein
MKNYKCFYTDESGETQSGDIVKVEASTPEDAIAKFSAQSDNLTGHISVSWGFGKQLIFPVLDFLNKVKAQEKSERDRVKAQKKSERDSLASRHVEALENSLSKETQSGSYLELRSATRVTMSNYLSYLVTEFETRGLEPFEIKFIHAWMDVKDRGLGESLIAKRIASLPVAKRSNSQFANMMLLGMMASTRKLDDGLNDMQEEIASIGDDVSEMQEDVEDVNEGFGFDE